MSDQGGTIKRMCPDAQQVLIDAAFLDQTVVAYWGAPQSEVDADGAFFRVLRYDADGSRVYSVEVRPEGYVICLDGRPRFLFPLPDGQAEELFREAEFAAVMVAAQERLLATQN